MANAIDLQALETFNTVVKTGSFTKAADRLHLSQPAVSAQMKRLETDLGVTLFYRWGSGVGLTSEGQQLYPLMEEVVLASRRCREHASELAGMRRGQVIMSSGAVQAVAFLPPIISLFARRYPDIELRLHVMPSMASVAALKRGEVHLSLLSTAPQDERLAIELLYRDEIVLIAPPNDSHVPDRLVTFSSGSGYRAFVDSVLEGATARPSSVLEIDDIGAIISMVCQGIGIAFVPMAAAAGHLKRSEVRLLPGGPADLKRSIYLAWDKRRPLSKADRALLETIRVSTRRS